MNFSKYLTYLREKAHLTKSQLASSVGITATYISNMEHGRNRAPEYSICDKIATALKLSESEKNKFFELAFNERVKEKNQNFFDRINSHQDYNLSPEIVEALKNPIAVKALLATQSLDKKTAKAMEKALQILEGMSPDRIEALLKVIN